MAFPLKTLAVRSGLLTPPELLFFLRVKSLHSCKSVKQHHTSAELCARAEHWWPIRKTSTEHTRVGGPLSKTNSTPEVHNDETHWLSKGTSPQSFMRPYGDNQTSLQGCWGTQSSLPAIVQCSALANTVFVSKTLSPLSRAAKTEEEGKATHFGALGSIPGLTPSVWHTCTALYPMMVALLRLHLSVRKILGHHHHPCILVQTAEKQKQYIVSHGIWVNALHFFWLFYSYT